MKKFKVIFDGKEIVGLDVVAEDIEGAENYVNFLVYGYKSYGFSVEEA